MDGRRKLVGSSVKMYLTTAEIRIWLERLRQLLEPHTTDEVDVFVLPPFVSLPAAAEVLRGSRIAYGAQNMHWADRGPHTGEVSPLMLRELGASFVELGHAERRRDNAETDETVNLKVLAALRHGLRPIVCIGEQAVSAAPDTVLREQLDAALAGVGEPALEHVVIAYEPIWAIGKAQAAPPAYVFERHERIRLHLEERYGREAGRTATIIYGGSVTPQNAATLLAHESVQGLFVGRSALAADAFAEIVRSACGAVGGGGVGGLL